MQGLSARHEQVAKAAVQLIYYGTIGTVANGDDARHLLLVAEDVVLSAIEIVAQLSVDKRDMRARALDALMDDLHEAVARLNAAQV